MWPSLPSSRKGGLVIQQAVDQACQGWVVTSDGKPWGVWLDDTTPDLDLWVARAVAKYGPLSQPVFVCVPPGRAGLHHKPEPPIINVYEWYPYGSGVPRSAWPKLPPKGYRAYICQWAFPGVASRKPLTRRQRLSLLAGVLLRHPRYIFLF